MKFLLILAFKVLFYLHVDCVVSSESVIFVNLLWRHGERTPVSFHYSSPYHDKKYWPEGLGQLTNTGKRQQYELGRWLRQRYDHLLTDQYSPDLVRVHSTDVDRTLMSAQANMAGMFPPKGRQVWETSLPWQPVPIHTAPEDVDRKSSAGDGGVIDLTYIHDTWDSLTIEKRNGYSLPKWAEPIMPRLHEIGKYRFLIETCTKKLGRLKSGLLIEEIVENLRNRTEQLSSRVANIYSGHDTTIANLLHTLGVYDGEVPPLASCVMVELRQNHGRHFVTIFYRNSTTEDPHLLTLPGCAPACPLDRFFSLTKPLIPEDWDKECQES
ncbi:prostatic acid phosphatase-like [Macrosteles quadrilineatus]|uniref:prostatic acid phosphatase-like n=1 Tax=Macrosteles quadrilineatus TaxID=74068 RepID=UPI0023E2748A|nr:prostatic acid phosphatase-like [Macrosteles quadrilineatus]